MIKFGIKLWIINKNWFSEAVDLYNKKQIDLIELYIVPDSFNVSDLKNLRKTEIVIHAPHYEHDFNIFKLNKEKINLFNSQVIKTADFLNSKLIVLHAGIGKDHNIFKRNIDKIYDSRIIIENKPKISLNNKTCFGYSLEQLEFVKNKCKLNICLDIGHAIKSAISQKIDYKNYLELLIKQLKPSYFHICDGKLNNQQDEHFNLGQGDYDLQWIKNFLLKLAKKQDIYLIFEVPKNKSDLKNDLKNIKYFKNIYRE